MYKLYCVKIMTDGVVVDVQHIVDRDNKSVHKRMDIFLQQCQLYNINYNEYSFYELNGVNGFKINLERVPTVAPQGMDF